MFISRCPPLECLRRTPTWLSESSMFESRHTYTDTSWTTVCTSAEDVWKCEVAFIVCVSLTNFVNTSRTMNLKRELWRCDGNFPSKLISFYSIYAAPLARGRKKCIVCSWEIRVEASSCSLRKKQHIPSSSAIITPLHRCIVFSSQVYCLLFLSLCLSLSISRSVSLSLSLSLPWKGVTLNNHSTWSDHFLATRFVFVLYQHYLTFDFIFQSEPHVPSFQMGTVILSWIHKKWLEWFHRNTQIIGSVRFSTLVVNKCSVCGRSHQNLSFEA